MTDNCRVVTDAAALMRANAFMMHLPSRHPDAGRRVVVAQVGPRQPSIALSFKQQK
jgi:hypothetical protein